MTEPNMAPADPLEMATNLLGTVRAVAEAQDRDPLGATVQRLERHGRAAAELAAWLGAVSIARDLRRIADHLTGSGS